MEPTLEQLIDMIDTDPSGSPVIAGTEVTVEEILSQLAAGWFLGDIMEAHGWTTDKPVLAAVAYAESLPPQHPLAMKRNQYREHLKQKVRGILTEVKQHFEALYGSRLVQIVLFGSQARGDANPGSDIDILVVLKGPVDYKLPHRIGGRGFQ